MKLPMNYEVCIQCILCFLSFYVLYNLYQIQMYDCKVCLLLAGKTDCASDKTVYFVVISLVKLDSEAKARAQSLPLVPCRCPMG